MAPTSDIEGDPHGDTIQLYDGYNDRGGLRGVTVRQRNRRRLELVAHECRKPGVRRAMRAESYGFVWERPRRAVAEPVTFVRYIDGDANGRGLWNV